MSVKKKVGIIGASGYAGIELFRLLLNHPNVEITGLHSVSFEGRSVVEIYPNLREFSSLVFENEEDVIQNSDLIFTAVPYTAAEPIAKKCDVSGKICIDLGADFRLEEEDYQEWYGASYLEPTLHQKAVYGLPELFREEIEGKSIIGNPGCYPTASALGLAPILGNISSIKSVIIDAKSGVTGAGRSLSEITHFVQVNEGFAPYKIAEHRHTPEIEQTLSKISGNSVSLTFVPHLLPINRGILATIYVDLPVQMELDTLYSLYQNFYRKERFVRVLPLGEVANLKNVKYSNFCDISIHLDQRTNRAIIVSAIDNMVKGSAGQAIQNMNILFGFSEDLGLLMIPPAF